MGIGGGLFSFTGSAEHVCAMYGSCLCVRAMCAFHVCDMRVRCALCVVFPYIQVKLVATCIL